MRTRFAIHSALLACALLLFGGAGRASEFDRAMEPILAEYLKIHGALAADTTEGIEPAVEAIAKAARELEPAQLAGEHAEQYRHIPHEIAAACKKLRAARDIEATREAFKELSKPLSTWVAVAEPEGASVMHCSMAKASWVQRGPAVANPYTGTEMSSCGEHVAGEPMGGEHRHEAHRDAQHGGGRE
jgi:Cu(I)/Ag(I) efflux system membrane fusion protein